MTDWMMWLALAGVLVILEMFSGTFYLLMIALGLVAGAIMATLGFSHSTQMEVAALVGIIATYALRRSKYGRRSRVEAARDRSVNLDIGETLRVESWQLEHGIASTRSQYRGAMWDIELVPGFEAQPGLFVIHEIRGSRLIVAPAVQ